MVRKIQNVRNAFIIISIVVVTLCGFATAAHAQFTIVSNAVVFNPLNRNVLFTLEFNQPPDFLTIDDFGRQDVSFQYFIVGDPHLPYPDLYDSIIRGEEIHITHDTIRIRNAVPPVFHLNPRSARPADPATGGWGSIRATVPFALTDNVLTFLARLSVISDHSTDGHFSFDLESYVFGGLTDGVRGESTILTLGQPRTPGCVDQSVSALINQYGSLDAAAEVWGFPGVQTLQNAIRAFCGS